MKQRKLLVVLGLIVIIMIIIFTGYPFLHKQISNPTKIVRSPINVHVVIAKVEPLPEILQLIGGLYAKRTVNIAAQIGGIIQNINFVYGQKVQKGQALYQLDDSLYQAHYQAAKADLRLSTLTYNRVVRLSHGNAVSKEEADKAIANYRDIQAQLKVAQTQLQKMHIMAPFTGVISASHVDKGQFVQPGEMLATLTDKTLLIARYSVPEQYLAQLKIGQKVIIKSSAYPKELFTGSVIYISPTINSTTRTITLWAEIPNPANLLSPGLFVSITHYLVKQQPTLVIPAQALIPTVSGNNVFIIRNNKAIQQSVIIGESLNSNIEIKKGIQPGDIVVIAGQEKLQQGTPVRVLNG